MTLTVDNAIWPGEYSVSVRRDPLHKQFKSIVVLATGIDLRVARDVHARVLEVAESCLVQVDEPRDEAFIRTPCKLVSYSSFVTEITGWSYRAEFAVR